MDRAVIPLADIGFTGTIGLGSAIVLAAMGLVGAVGLFRSNNARTWRENAEAEKARADRLETEKATLERAKVELEAQWTRRQSAANETHATEVRDLTERIHVLELAIAELRARPTVDDLAIAMKTLHEDSEGQTVVLHEIRDALITNRRRDPSARTRASDDTQL